MNVLQSTILRYYCVKAIMRECANSALFVSSRHCSNTQITVAGEEQADHNNVECDSGGTKYNVSTNQLEMEQSKIKEHSTSFNTDLPNKFYSRVKPTQVKLTLQNSCNTEFSSLPELEQVLHRRAHLPVPEWATRMRVIRPMKTTISLSENQIKTRQNKVKNDNKSTSSKLTRQGSKMHSVETIAALAMESLKSEEPYIPLLYRIGLITPPTPLDLSCCVPLNKPNNTNEHKVANNNDKVMRTREHDEKKSSHNDDDDDDGSRNENYLKEISDTKQKNLILSLESDDKLENNAKNKESQESELEEEQEELEWQNISENKFDTLSLSESLTTSTNSCTTNRVFLDPVEWLSQAPSFPLMSESVVSAHFAPVQYGTSSLQLELSSTSLHECTPLSTEEMHNRNEQKYSEHSNKSLLSEEEQHAECARLEQAIKTMQTHKDENKNLMVSSNNELKHMDSVSKITLSHSDDNDNVDEKSRNTTNVTQDSMSSTKDSKSSEELIYNIFTRRVSKANSVTIKTLSLMGIAPDCTKRELIVHDKVALHNFATAIQSQCISWPTFWSHGYVYHQLRSIICESSEDQLDSKVNELLQMQYEMLRRRRNERQLTGVVSASELTHLTNSNEEEQEKETSLSVHTNTSSTSESITGMLDDKWLTIDKLNEEQQAVVEFIREGGYHTYVGGGAGSGKSVLLKMIRKILVHDGLTVAMVATTGVASCQIGGVTLHHLLGINQHGDFTRRSELTAYDVIIIDEVSMLGRDLFEKLEYKLRRAHGMDVPFGGVQMILCGDFMQLGAINAQSLITSPLFRRHFAMLKLYNVIRQSEDVQYAAQLQMLRRGKVPDNLHKTVSLQTTEQILIEQLQRYALAIRQRRQLSFALRQCISNNSNNKDNVTENDNKETTEAQLWHNTCNTLQPVHCSNSIFNTESSHVIESNPSLIENENNNSNSKCGLCKPTPSYVENAVNLLPTNTEVNEINSRELARLNGDEVCFASQILTPTLLGNWTQTYLLRISHPCIEECNNTNKNNSTIKQQDNFSKVHKIIVEFVNLFVLKYKDSGNAASLHPHRHVVLYKLFVDGYCLRVRIPDDFDMNDCQKLSDHFKELNTFLQTFDVGLTVCDLLDSGEGMHTEQDELILHSYAIKAAHSRETKLKKGARVMLRANLAPSLVNGSIGTVIGFRECTTRDIPRYLLPYADVSSKSTNSNNNNLNAYREEVIKGYADFLVYECGFTKALLPEVELNGRVYVIPPIVYFVGGLHNTHHYSMGVAHLPLSLAYAFTVHKVQGLTLVGRVHLELSRMWPCDHLLYVAMSRVRNPEQLSMSSFSAKLVQAAADCLLFDDSLPSVYNVNVLPSFIQATWKRTPQRRKRLLRQRKLLDEMKRKNRNLAKNTSHNNLSRQIALIQQRMLQAVTLNRKNTKK